MGVVSTGRVSLQLKGMRIGGWLFWFRGGGKARVLIFVDKTRLEKGIKECAFANERSRMNGSDPSSQTAQESAGFQTISGTKIITDSVNGGPQLVITKPTGTDWLTEEEIDLLIEKRRKREEKLKRRAKSSKAYSAVKATSAQASSFAKRFLVEGSTTVSSEPFPGPSL